MHLLPPPTCLQRRPRLLRPQVWLLWLHQLKQAGPSRSSLQSVVCHVSRTHQRLEGSPVLLQVRNVLPVSVRSHTTAMSVMALRKCSQHSLDRTLQCLQSLLNTKAYIHSNHRSSSLNLRRCNRAANRKTTVLLLVLCQIQERRKDSRRSRACSARVTLLQSYKGGSRCQGKRRRRRRLRDIRVNLSCSLHPPSSGRLRTPSSSLLRNQV